MSAKQTNNTKSYTDAAQMSASIRAWQVDNWIAKLAQTNVTFRDAEMFETKSPTVFRATCLFSFERQRLEKSDFFLCRDFIKAVMGAQSDVTLRPFKQDGIMFLRATWFCYAPR